MRPVLIATGNPLRGDDGVAHAVVERLPNVESRALIQLTPEVAAEIAAYDAVVFIDADVRTKRIALEPLEQSSDSSVFTHHSSPADVVKFSSQLFGFSGRAFVCHIPAVDFAAREGLSVSATMLAAEAARKLTTLLDGLA